MSEEPPRESSPTPSSESKHSNKLSAYFHSDSFHTSRDAFLTKTKDITTTSLLKSKLAIQHSLGLGARPNCVPWGEASVSGPLREVRIGWHPVAGFGGKWFADKTGLGKMITKGVGKYPDPTQHWAVLVGEYVHELWMDEGLDVIYINERVEDSEWHTFEVGRTRFSDEALRQAGEMVIHNMRSKRPAYNVISNNCQNFAVAMLDAIQIGAHQKFATTFEVYQRATGAGTIKDLFVDHHPEEQSTNVALGVGVGQVGTGNALPVAGTEGGSGDGVEGMGRLHRTDTVQNAQIVMDQETTKLDDHHKLFS